MNCLHDDELEKRGLIKEINTLGIINEASEIKSKKVKKIYIAMFILMLISAVLGQLIFIKIFGFVNQVMVGIGIYVIVSVGILIKFLVKGEDDVCCH